MINTKEKLKAVLKYEKSKYYVSSGKKINIIGRIKFKYGEKGIIWKYQNNLRKWEYCLNKNKKILKYFYMYKTKKSGLKYGLNISPNTFGQGLHIMHLGSILVNDNVRVGNDCSIHINTAIVAGGNNSATPKVGNGVIIGIGATLLGDIEIADNIAIGAGSVVNKSFTEPNIAIAGVPAKKISDNGAQTWRDINKN